MFGDFFTRSCHRVCRQDGDGRVVGTADGGDWLSWLGRRRWSDLATRLIGLRRGDPRRGEDQERGQGETSVAWHPWHGVRLPQKGACRSGRDSRCYQNGVNLPRFARTLCNVSADIKHPQNCRLCRQESLWAGARDTRMRRRGTWVERGRVLNCAMTDIRGG